MTKRNCPASKYIGHPVALGDGTSSADWKIIHAYNRRARGMARFGVGQCIVVLALIATPSTTQKVAFPTEDTVVFSEKGTAAVFYGDQTIRVFSKNHLRMSSFSA